MEMRVKTPGHVSGLSEPIIVRRPSELCDGTIPTDYVTGLSQLIIPIDYATGLSQLIRGRDYGTILIM